ncbi:DUF7507 domain-containing protein [Sellimonas intestinalis]|uniref:DUF7507 domain-containing protein n=2 Tax=Sellimonas intestinalis TaxID=1653434 RepID=UPI0034C2DD7C
MRRAKRITALAVAAAMVLSNVAYAAPDTNTTTTQQGAESLNSQSDASGGVKDQASDTKGNTSTSASQSKEQVKQNESSQSTDPGDQKQTDSKADVVSQNQDQKKDEDSKETQKPSTEADSQKSETQNVDADKSEDTQEPSKEQEKVLYDITFDTPEKHGRVTDLDGKEVADGKTLKTDENGKVKFKVKPDDGYQVQAVYQMPDEQTPLKLVTDSYYEMQVEKNTTVKVVYQKIPASEEESDGETKKTDTNQNEVQTPTNEDETNKAAESTDKKATTQSDESDTTGGEPSAGDTNGGISALTISGKNVVYVGEDITLTSDESGGWQHQWEADSGYVTVKKNSDTKATVTGVKAGTATITHSWNTGIPIVGQKSHRETFTVTVVNKLVTSIEIQQDSKKVESLSLNTGDEATLKAVVKPDEATNKNVTWSSSAGDVVQVDNGKLTAVKAGEARITASASDGSGVKAEVKVTVTDVAVKEITVSGEVNQTVLEGGKIQLAVNFVPENATNKGLKWKSLNSDIATVDENGIVTGVKNGTATIQATSVVNPEAVATFSVLVEEIYMTEFTVVADRTTVTVGDTATVRAIIKPDEYPNKEVRWESMDPTVATVNENGVVTTKATGPVTIKGTSKADPNSSATVTILVEDVKAESVTISGYNQNYLTSGSTVTLTATVKPDAAANKTIVWSSSNTDIVTVDQNGKVTAKNQGTGTVRALNEYTGLYDEVEIMVYNKEPQTVQVRVWVTNQLKTTVNINLPSDGTPVTLTDVLPTYVSSDSEEYVYCGPVYIHNYPNGTGWESIKDQPKAVRLRYLNRNVQYSTSLDGQWNNLRNNNVNAQYELLYSGNEEDDTDVNVVVGDWPYTNGTMTNKILRIRIYNSETGKYDYDSGSMYYDNGSNGAYGKIKFNCDESRYEVAKITVEKYDSRYSDRPSSTTNVEEPVSVEFHKKEEYERYVVTATVRAKEFTVHYDSNGGSNDVPEDQKIKAINGNTVTVASSPQPTKAGYVFAGWSYGGKTYFGGEVFEMPASNVTFVANWIEASQAINYKVNDAAMGTVTRSYERVTSQTSIEDLQGSLATPKDGYHFVKWIDEEGQIVSEHQYFKPTTPKPATYTAVFAIKLNETDFEVSGLSNHVYDGENHKDVPVVTKKGSKDALEEGTDYTVSYDTENFVDVKTITVTITGKGNYSGVVTKTYQITERPIEVTGKQEEFTYDGTLHKVEGVTATNLVEGHKISSKDAVAERTEEGQTNMGLTQSSSYEIKDAGDKDVTKNYSISKVTDGYVKINADGLNETDFEVSGLSNHVYDGENHKDVPVVTKKGSKDALEEGTDYTVSYDTENFVDVKTITVTITGKGNYSGVVTKTYQITERPIEVTGKQEEFTYDGTLHKVEGVTATNLVEGHKISSKDAVAERTEEGQTNMGLTQSSSYEIKDAGDKDVTKNYSISKVTDGYVKINADGLNETDFEVSGLSNHVYDGENHKDVPVVTKKGSKDALEEGTDYTVSYDTENFVDVKTITVTITGKGNYSGVVTKTYQITERPIEVTGKQEEFTYDGTLHKVEGVTATNLVEGHKISSKDAVAERTEEGQTNMGLTQSSSYEIKDAGDKDVTKNYSISKVTDGYVKINADGLNETDFEVSGLSNHVYDGENHKDVPVVTKKGSKDALEEGTDYTVSYDTENFVDVKTITVTITGKGNYSGVVTKAYQITERPIEVTGKQEEFTYDGTLHKVEGVTATNLVEGHKISSKDAVAERTEEGQTNMGLTQSSSYEIKDAGDKDVTKNYSISKVTDGYVKINADGLNETDFEVSGLSNHVYDGENHKDVPVVTKKGSKDALEEGTDYTVSYDTENFVDVKTITVTITGKGNYSGVVTKTYQITERPIEVTGKQEEFTYDGTLHKVEGVTATNLVEGHKISSKDAVAERTEEGQTNMGLTQSSSYEIKDAGDKDVTKNYSISKVTDGYVKINADGLNETDFEVSGLSNHVYDGENHKDVPVVTKKGSKDALEEGTDYTVSYDTENFVDVKTITVTITGKGNYSGVVTKTYQITERPIEVTGKQEEFTYDGTLHKVEGVTATNLVEGHKISSKDAVAERTEEGQTNMGLTQSSSYEIKDAGDKDVTKNYSISKVTDGYVKINADGLNETDFEVSGLSNHVYDGENHKDVPVVTKKGSKDALEEGTDYTVSYDTENFVDVKTITVTITGKGNYSGVVTKAYQITERPIEVTGKQEEFTYDGTLHKVEGVTATNLVEGHKISSKDAVAERTEEGQTNMGLTQSSSYEIKDAGDKDVTKNYSISKVTDGYVKINADGLNETDFEVSGLSNHVYDGENHKDVPVVTKKGSKDALEEGTDYTVSYDTENFVDVKTITVTITGKGNYSGVVTKTYQITERPIEVTGKQEEFTYDGTLHKVEGVTATNLVEGHKISSKDAVAERTEEGQTNMGLTQSSSYEIKDAGDKDVTKNYSISKVTDGYVKINADGLNETDFEVSGLSNHVYDGENHKDVPVVTKKGSKDALEEGTDYTVSYDTENFVDVKTITVTITGKGNYSGVVTKTYQITERPIEVTGKQEEFTYDGTLHKVEGVTATNLVEGHKISSKDAVAERTEEGQTNMGLTQSSSYEIKDAGDKDVTKNYSISKVTDGYVKIQRNTTDLKFVEAETTGYNGVYDGAAHDAVTSVKVTGVNGEEIAAEDMTVEYRLSDEADWGKMPQVTDVADSTAVQIRVTVANYDPITTTVQATVTQKPVTITTESASKTYDASALTAPGEVEGIVEGETYGFEITGSQTLVGTSENSYVMTWAGEGNEYSAKSDNYTVTERVGTLTVTDGSEEEPINPEDVVKKTHGTPEGGVYKAGDVVTFTVTATNIYDEVKTITLNEIAGVTLKDTVFADVQPGETVETTATYTITEADVLAGEFVNTVTASFSGEEDTPFEDDDQVDEIEEPKGHLTIDKVTTSEPANGSSYALGETITYKITATNDGNLTLTNVKVVDELTGDEWEIASLAPGASEEFDTSYTVTEADILAGSVVNTATAEGTSPDPDKPDVPVNPGEEEEPTETEKPSLFVEKTAQPDEDGVYNLGDEIHYVIKVTNNGNVTVNDITVKDELTGDEWQLDSLTPGESEEYHATYTVTEEDILAGSITNVATAEGTDPDEDPVDQEGEETVPTDSADSHLTIHKATTSDPGDDGVYDLGDTITYEIIAANDGNVTLNNVVVTDELTGDEWIIETLAPGVSETFEAEYVVTEEDIHNGSVVNEATATAEGPEEPVITPGETEDETNPENPSLTVDKSIVEEKDEYEIGDVIEYEITVANNGNVTQNDVRVTDLLQAAGDIVITGVEGADGEIDGAIVTLDSLAPGESATIHCEYTVLKEDRGSTITNAAIADDEGKGDGEDPVTPDVPAEVADVYDINVVHQFADGEEGEAELPDDYTIENQPVGTEREITAETVEGYTVSPASQEVTIEDSDVTITFVYYADEIGTDPENPDTPDNVPDRYQAVVTFEAVNGTVDRSAAVVTLMRNGQPAEDGTGYLTEDQIATARANVGYAQNSLTWSPGTPTAEYKVTGDMTFTASFSAIPVIPGDGGEEPVEPTNPTTPTTPARPSTPTTPTLPVTPANPGTTVTPTLPVTPQTAAPAARVYADGVVVDDPQTATDDYDLNEVERDAGTETIDEDSTPLGNMDLEKDDDHKCCILHFILLLLALIVELIYTHDRKKRQERIFELRRELADFDETV